MSDVTPASDEELEAIDAGTFPTRMRSWEWAAVRARLDAEKAALAQTNEWLREAEAERDALRERLTIATEALDAVVFLDADAESRDVAGDALARIREATNG